MNNILFLSIFLCVQFAQAQEANFSQYELHTQNELKATIEREQKLQSAQRHRVLYERASSLESIQLQKQNHSTFKKLSSDVKSWWHSTQQYMQIQILQKFGIQDFGRRVWRTLQGKRSLPPTSHGLSYSINGDSKIARFHIIAEDPDGTIDRFEFDYGDGTSQVVPYSDYEKMYFHIDHLYLANDNYNVSVKVVDDTGDYSIFTQFVAVINNDLPIPKFSIQRNQVPNFLKADFTSLSTDTDGTVVNYFWNLGDGNFHSANSGVPFSHTYSAPGTYYVSLDVWDNNNGHAMTGSTPIHIGVTPPAGGSPPFAMVRSDKRAGVVPFTVLLNGESSFDLEGTPLSYEWDIGDGSHPFRTANVSEAKFKLTQSGTYYSSLKVTDAGGQQNSHYFTIYGLPTGSLRAPMIIAYPSGDKTVSFDSNRYAINIPATYNTLFWDFGDGSPEVNQAYPMHTYAAYGTYTVTLRAYDVLGNYHVVQKTLNITNDLSTPQSFFDASSLSGPVDTTITFTTQNQHLVASTTTAIWDFGDGSRQTGLHEDLLVVTHSYEEPGLYPVTLIVTDADGKSSVFVSQVLVHEQTPIVTARVEVSDLIGPVPFPVRFDGRTSSSTAGPISSIRWQLDTPWGQIHNQSSVMTQVFNTGGDIWGRMYATDSAGNMGVQFFSLVAVDPTQVPPWNNTPIAQIHINFDNQYGAGWVELNGFSSYDPDGDRIISYEWSFDGKILPQSIWGIAHLTANDTEEHIVGLKVTDRWGAVGETSVRFKYPQDHQTPPANLPPVGLIQIDYLNMGNPAQVQFSSAGSYDPDGDRIARYEWNLDGSSLAEGDTVTTSVEDGVEHIITLKLTDRWGAASERKIRFRNPTISYLVTPDRPVVDEEVHFYTDHLTIQLPETVITQQRWDFGDGSPYAYGPHVQHTYTSAGTYTATLFITDNLNRTYTTTQTVTVEEELAPIVIITAQDMQPIYEVYGTQNFNWNTFPVEVQFDLNRSSVQGMGLVSATWNFGDGNTGFGLNPSYVYRKPGMYTVTVTATDENGLTGNSSMEVFIGTDNCSDTDGIEGCLRLTNSHGNTLPMSSTFWAIGHDAGTQYWEPEVGDTEIMFLKTVDTGSELEYNISTAVIVNNGQLEIQKTDLQTMGVDFTRTYALIVGTMLDDETEYSGMFPELNFGIGTVNITTNEVGIKLVISGTNGYKKYVDMGSNTTGQLVDLPVGTYSVVATKESRNLNYTFQISDATPQALSIDLSVRNINQYRQSLEKYIRTRNSKIGEDSFAKKMKEFYANQKGDGKWPTNNETFPDWAYDSCGNKGPFPVTILRPPAPNGKSYSNYFTSANPFEQSNFFSIGYEDGFDKKVKLTCNIQAVTSTYSLYRWKYVDGHLRCNESQINPYWYTYQTASNIGMQRPVRVKYTIQDQITGRETSGVFVSSYINEMIKRGWNLSNITQHQGITNWRGVPFESDILIPDTFKRPMIKFELDSYHSPNNDLNFFVVGCDLEKTHIRMPGVEAVKILDDEVNNLRKDPLTRYTAVDNGQRFLMKKFLPVDIDEQLKNYKPDMFKATVKVIINKGTFKLKDFKKIEISLMRNNVKVGSAVKYDLLNLAEYDNNRIIAQLTLNAEDFSQLNYAEWKVSDVFRIDFSPDVEEFLAGEKDKKYERPVEVIPFFDMKKVNADTNGAICANGFYNVFQNNKVSAYAQGKLIDMFKKYTAAPYNIKFRCNDVSAPWGGSFNPIAPLIHPGWYHGGHDDGLKADVRYFSLTHNEINGVNDQDRYDQPNAQPRRDDLNLYLKFSSWAKNIAEKSENLSTKEALYNICQDVRSPLSPCDTLSNISEFNHEKIVQFCKWNYTKSTVATLCSPSAAVGWYNAAKKYSKWAELNFHNVRTLAKGFNRIIISTGYLATQYTKPDNLVTMGPEWQKYALFSALWPDSLKIYKIDEFDHFSNDWIRSEPFDDSIEKCFPKRESPEIHLNHIHLEVESNKACI